MRLVQKIVNSLQLAAQMTASLLPSTGAIKARELIDAALVPELEKEGRCTF